MRQAVAELSLQSPVARNRAIHQIEFIAPIQEIT
jgi:hypothetical protein